MAESARAGHLRRTYGLTEADYDALLRNQGGRCAICRKPPAKRRLEVDHNHKTGEVRGLLCWYCNKKRVGRETDALIFEKTAAYLRRPPARQILGRHYVPPKPKRKRRKKNV